LLPLRYFVWLERPEPQMASSSTARLGMAPTASDLGALLAVNERVQLSLAGPALTSYPAVVMAIALAEPPGP